MFPDATNTTDDSVFDTTIADEMSGDTMFTTGADTTIADTTVTGDTVDTGIVADSTDTSTMPVEELPIVDDTPDTTMPDSGLLTEQPITGDDATHSSATDGSTFDPFEDIGKSIDGTTMPVTKEQLQFYVEQGQKYWNQGRENGDRDMIKYGMFITKKSQTYLQQLENGETLNPESVKQDIQVFDRYISQWTTATS